MRQAKENRLSKIVTRIVKPLDKMNRALEIAIAKLVGIQPATV